jgi:hypothetical protein
MCFAANNLDKTNTMNFITNYLLQSALCVGYKESYVEDTVNTKLLGLQIDDDLNWKNPY